MATHDYLYIGNLPLADTTDGRAGNPGTLENPNILLGTFEAPDIEMVALTTTPAGPGNLIYTDDGNNTPQNITYDLGNGTVTSTLDALAQVRDGYFILSDGSQVESSRYYVMQMENGDTFIGGVAWREDFQPIVPPDLIAGIHLEQHFFAPNPINYGSMSFDRSSYFDGSVVICFTAGTMIATPEGERAIEDLRAGDMVLTMDDGAQPIRWIGENVFDKTALEANPRLLPIRIQAGSLGPNLPKEDLLVSRQHRILVRSKIAFRMFGSQEVLVPANKLLAVDGIDIAWDVEEVSYWHFLCDRHQIVWANGAAAESLFTGPEALKAVSPEAREEIMTIFPEICQEGFAPEPARNIPEKGHKIKSMARRHNQRRMAVFHAE